MAKTKYLEIETEKNIVKTLLAQQKEIIVRQHGNSENRTYR